MKQTRTQNGNTAGQNTTRTYHMPGNKTDAKQIITEIKQSRTQNGNKAYQNTTRKSNSPEDNKVNKRNRT